MKNRINWIIVTIVTISLLFSFIGCKDPEPIELDQTAPAEVTNLSVTAADGNAVLTWKNPSDADFAGVQVSMNPAEGTLANAVSLGKDVTRLKVSGLEIGSEYTFTVKTFDTSLNYSTGATEKATVADTADYVAPANVTNLVATNKDASVLLTWIDATDEDVFGYEVTWNKSTPINRSAAMEANSMIVAPGAKGCFVSNLTNGIEYTFTVKSVDTSGNKSTGVTKTITPSIIEKSILQIALEPNTTEKTNQDVVISVNATTDNASEVKKIAYKEGTLADIESVLSGTDISTTKEITATKNTTYTVAATDTAGRRELAFITVSNIDKVAPAQVGNTVVSYSRNSNRIDLSWTNPVDTDFAGTVITYGKTDSEEVITIELAKDKTSTVIENIADDDSEYTIAIKTKDDVGNLSEAKTVTVVAATGAKVTNISLNRTHLDSIMTNREIVVTVSGSNFDLLTSLLVQVTDGKTAQKSVVAVIDAENNTATATVSAPVPSSPTDEGTTYTVKAIIDSTTPAETIATFVVSKPADVTSITLSESQIKVGTAEKVTATITGTNFDIRGVTQVKLFDASKESTVTVPLEANTSNTEFTVEIPVPNAEGFYTVAVFFDDVKDNTTTTLQVYGVPEITSVTIPAAGVSYGGNSLPVTIKGKNFTAPGISESSFSGTGAGITNFVVVSDTKATAEVMCPYVAGSTNVTVNCTEASATATVKVVATESCYAVGDILFTDGTRIKAENVQYGVPDSQKEKAFAVIVSAPYGGGTGKAVGLQKSSSSLAWAPSGTTGYSTNFTEIQSGDLDGSDNWEEICKVDPEGTADAATNYPAFNFALNYGETAGLTDTDYETGWYIPSVAELYDVKRNKEVVQTSLTAVGGFTLETSLFWSSSQDASYYGYAYLVSFYYNVYDDDYLKSNNYGVLVIQAFNAGLFNNYEAKTTPSITSVTIPTAGEGYTGELPVTIEGTNLKGHAITSSDTSFSNVTYASDTKVTATITCNSAVGETTVTVNCAEASGTATLKVLESGNCYTDADIGKIVLEDGRIVTKDDYDSSTMKAIAVVVGTKYAGGQVLGVGLQQSSSLMWAAGTTGYEIKFENIICTPSETGSGAASTATFAGDIDGSDNWAYICSIDPEGTKDAATNYPAFDYANNYGVTQGITGNYKDGWYIPSLKELCDIYKVKDTVKDVITAVGGNLDMSSWYWSSSQRASFNYCAYSVNFYDGDVEEYDYKNNDNDVLVIQAFNAE